MRYDFDKLTRRSGTDCWKWDIDREEEGVVPLWVADMDFEVAPRITAALRERVEHGIFGYTKVPMSFYDSIRGWYSRRYGWEIENEWIEYTTGVVPAVSAIIKALSGGEGCGVLVQTPAYNHFFSSIRNNGCRVVENRLVRSGDSYDIDFEDFERKAADGGTRIFLLCSPHNPVGRIWSAEELRRMAGICHRHGVKIIADEIHSGLIMPGEVFTPFGMVGEEYQDEAVVTASCTKSFNVAGLGISYIIARNGEVRRLIDRAINVNEVCDVNPFGVIALQTAYNECEDWLGELCEYVKGNYETMKGMIEGGVAGWKVMRLQATYLAWVDCRSSGVSSEELGRRLLSEGRVRVSSGEIYGEPGGYIRINLACPRARLVEAVGRIVKIFGK